jgi:hypothetical protein
MVNDGKFSYLQAVWYGGRIGICLWKVRNTFLCLKIGNVATVLLLEAMYVNLGLWKAI